MRPAPVLPSVVPPSPPSRLRIDGGPWRWDAAGRKWLHRPWWKVAINAVLRLFQPQARKWVIYSATEGGEDGRDLPRVLSYGFGRILHLPR